MKKEPRLPTKEVVKAENLVIADQKDMVVAVELLSRLNTIADGLEADRVKLTKPLNDALREINSRYKPAREALEGVIKGLRGKMTQYTTMRLEEVKRAELEATKAIEGGVGSLETALEVIEGVGDVQTSVTTKSGAVSFIEVDKFEVVDFAKLPDEYKLANETAIRLAKKNGIEVSGVRYWKEQSVRNRR